MPEDTFSDNLLRAAVAELHVQNLTQAAVGIYHKTFWELTPDEQGQLQSRVMPLVGAIYNLLTPEFLSTASSTAVLPFGTPSSKLQ